MKSTLITIVLSFAAGAGFATALLAPMSPALTPRAETASAGFDRSRLAPASPMDSGRCFELVAGEYRCDRSDGASPPDGSVGRK